MKHAILITAYKDIPYLLRLADTFDSDFRLYIHLDKKTCLAEEQINQLVDHPLIRCVEQVYKVNWGGFHHVDSILYLCKKAFDDEDNQYFHLISGADLITKKIKVFKDFFAQHQNENFLEYFPLPVGHWVEGGLNRLEWYHPLDRLNVHSQQGWLLYQRYLRRQKSKGRKRPLPDLQLYGGSTWWSLSRACIAYILENKNWKGLYDRLQCTFVPEEIYIPTLLLNSPLAKSVCNNHHRYICWEKRNGNIPAKLDLTDLIPILLSDSFFARKADPEISEKLLVALDTIRTFNLSMPDISGKSEKECLEAVAELLCKEVDLWPLNGLMCGRLGICLFLFHYSRATENKGYSDKAAQVLNHIILKSKADVADNSFDHGKMGIAASIEYLKNRDFIEIDSDKLMAKIDLFTLQALQMIANGEASSRWMPLYHFDIYVNERQRNRPVFENWSPAETSPKQIEAVERNRQLLKKLFEKPEQIACPGIIGLAGWGLVLLQRVYPLYKFHDTLLSDYLLLNDVSS